MVLFNELTLIQKGTNMHTEIMMKDNLSPKVAVGFDKTNSDLQVLAKINKALSQKLNEKSKQIKLLNDQLCLVEEKTRKSIAADLHDSVAQTLGFSSSLIKSIKEGSIENNDENLSKIEFCLKNATQEIRSTIYNLNPPILDDFEIDLAIGFLLAEFFTGQNCEIHFTNEVKSSIGLKGTKKTIIYRAVNELIHNIAKHSKADNAFVKISSTKNIFQIIIEDDGEGFCVDTINSSHSFGLSFIRERMRCMDGDMKIKSEPDKGTTIILSIPLEQ